jgi:ribonuclease P protein component
VLSQSHRFHGYGSLKGVYARGSSVRTSLVTAKFLNRGPSKKYRVAVVVSKKVSKSAVVRNRIRRRLYEAVRNQAQQIPDGTDLVLTVFAEQVATIESEKLQKAVAEILQKIATQMTPNDTSDPRRAIVKPEISNKEEI